MIIQRRFSYIPQCIKTEDLHIEYFTILLDEKPVGAPIWAQDEAIMIVNWLNLYHDWTEE